jgi:chromate transporter
MIGEHRAGGVGIVTRSRVAPGQKEPGGAGDARATGMLRLFRVWAGIGLQSFGGGATTTVLIQRAFVDRYGWITREEFNLYWTASVFTPGINLIGVAICIGRKLGGPRGILASLLGLLLPSAIVVCVLSAGLRAAHHLPLATAALHGVVPATAALMLLAAIGFADPLVQSARHGQWARSVAGLVVGLGCAIALAVVKVSVVVVLPVAALLGIALSIQGAPADGRATSRGVTEGV